MGFKRENIRSTSPLDIKKMNDNFMNLWQKLFGNINFADLDNGTKKIINSKVAQEDFESEISQLGDAISLKVSKDDVGTEITQNWESVKIAWNTISSYIQFIDGYLKVQHSDGSYTKLAYDGIERYSAGTAKSYHYLKGTVEFSGNQTQNSYTISVPEEFRGKSFIAIPHFKSIAIRTGISYPPSLAIQSYRCFVDAYGNNSIEIFASVREAVVEGGAYTPNPYEFVIIVDFIA